MTVPFRHPDFSNRNMELRFDGDEISIYATPEGLKKLIGFCNILLEDPQQGHIHMEDYGLLTNDSLRGTIAIFVNSG